MTKEKLRYEDPVDHTFDVYRTQFCENVEALAGRCRGIGHPFYDDKALGFETLVHYVRNFPLFTKEEWDEKRSGEFRMSLEEMARIKETDLERLNVKRRDKEVGEP